MHDVGREGAGDACLVLTLGAIVEQRPRRCRCRRGVGEVVGDDLLRVGTTRLRNVASSGGDHAVDEGEGFGRC